MDTDLLKTFIEVARLCHFGKAAKKLFVTQSAVSARIRLLEQEVGRPLFYRTRNNIQLTVYGTKLLKHAQEILLDWDNACNSLSMENELRPSVKIGGVSSLWDDSLFILLQKIDQYMKDIDLTAEIDIHDNLIEKLFNRQLDICFSYDALPLSKIVSKKIAEISLCMFSLEPDLDFTQALEMQHIMIDWSRNLTGQHSLLQKQFSRQTIRTNSARLALNLLLKKGGTVFLPSSFVQNFFEEKKIFMVRGSATYICPVYAHFSFEEENEPLIQTILKLCEACF